MGRVARCKIDSLERTDGSVAKDEDSIKKEILGFYEGLLGSPCPGSVQCTY